MTLTPNEYQRAALRTMCDQMKARERIHSQIIDEPQIPTQILHALIGIQGELGELSTVITKWLFYGKSYTVDEIRREVLEESGDMLWFIMELLSALGLNAEDVMKANIAKLKARYPERFTDELSAGRDTRAERIAMEEVSRPADCMTMHDIPRRPRRPKVENVQPPSMVEQVDEAARIADESKTEDV